MWPCGSVAEHGHWTPTVIPWVLPPQQPAEERIFRRQRSNARNFWIQHDKAVQMMCKRYADVDKLSVQCNQSRPRSTEHGSIGWNRLSVVWHAPESLIETCVKLCEKLTWITKMIVTSLNMAIFGVYVNFLLYIFGCILQIFTRIWKRCNLFRCSLESRLFRVKHRQTTAFDSWLQLELSSRTD